MAFGATRAVYREQDRTGAATHALLLIPMYLDKKLFDRFTLPDGDASSTDRWTARIVLVFLLLIYVCVRVTLILSNPRVIEPEELAEGMVALEFTSRGFEAIDILYGPASRLGSLVNGLLLVPIFKILGPTGAALQVPGLCFGIIAWLASVWIAREFGGIRSAFAVGALLACPPALLLKASLSSQGNHAEAMAFGMVVLALTVHLCRHGRARQENRGTGALIGMIAGFGLAYCWTTAIWCLAAALLVLFHNRRPWRMPWIRTAAMGLMLGMTPGLWVNWAAGQAGLGLPRSAAGMQRQTLAAIPLKTSSLLSRELPRAFRIRGTEKLPVGPPLAKVLPLGWPAESGVPRPGSLSPVRRTGVFTKTAAPGADILGRDPGGTAWLIAAIAALLVSVTLRFRRPGAGEPERHPYADAWVPGAAIIGAFSFLYIVGPFAVEWDYPLLDDDYIAYRYLLPAVHGCTLLLGMTLGSLATLPGARWRAGSVAALSALLLLGIVNTGCYILDPAHPWDPGRNSRVDGYNYGSVGSIIADRHRAEFEDAAASLRRGDPVDPEDWASIREVRTWVGKLDSKDSIPLFREFLQAVFSFRGLLEPGELHSFAETFRAVRMDRPYDQLLDTTIDELVDPFHADTTRGLRP